MNPQQNKCNKNHTSHIIVKLLKSKDKEKKNLKSVPQITFHTQELMIKMVVGASLVAQWLRICLPMQGTRVRALVWEDPTCRGATGPVSHNY